MLPRLPRRVPRVMGLSAAIVAVTAIIALDLDLLEFLLQELQVSAEKLMEIGFYA